jgi:hypothetical protein
MKNSPWLSISEAAERYNLRTHTIHNMIRRGDFPPWALRPRPIRWVLDPDAPPRGRGRHPFEIDTSLVIVDNGLLAQAEIERAKAKAQLDRLGFGPPKTLSELIKAKPAPEPKPPKPPKPTHRPNGRPILQYKPGWKRTKLGAVKA